MTWLSSFFVAALSGVLGLILTGLITAAFSQWFNVSNREGAAGYLMVANALLGGFVFFFVGLGISRWVATLPEPGFLKGLGYSCGVIVGLGGIAMLVGWLLADFAPKIDGKNLELAIEIRCPKDFTLPTEKDEYGAYARVYLPRRSSQPRGEVDPTKAKQVEGYLIVPAVVPLTTSASEKFIEVRLGKGHNLTFSLPLRSHPRHSDMEWSKWVDSGWEVGQPEPPPEKKFNLRIKVQLVKPEPPAPAHDPAKAEAEAFAALAPDAPLTQWLAFDRHDAPGAQQQAVRAMVATRLPELAQLIRSADEPTREAALGAVASLSATSPEITEAVVAEGQAIAEALQRFNTTDAADPKSLDVQIQLRSRFNYWKRAWWRVAGLNGADVRPPVQEIHDLALVRANDTTLSEIVANARAILNALPSSPQ